MAWEIIAGRSHSDIQKYKLEGTIFLGKHYVKMGDIMSLSNEVRIDVSNPHIILVSGKRGSGKCLHGDTLITLDNGSIIPIKELENNQNKVLGLDNKLKIKTIEKTEFFKRKVDKLLRIKLRSGKEIKLTPEHPLLTILGWEKAKNLQVGSRVATPRTLENFGFEELEEYKIKLLAYLLAEGHVGNGFVLFSNIDTKILSDFVKSVYKFDSNLKVSEHSKKGCYRVSQIKKKYKMSDYKRNVKGQFITGGVRYKKSSIVKWLKGISVYNKLAKEKDIPKEIFNLPKYQLALFLNRLFSCDGSIYKTTQWEISYSSSSEKLIRQVQHLLLKFGILSKLRTKKLKYKNQILKSFELVIGTNNLIKFLKEIGFYGQKQNLVKQALGEINKIQRNPNVDTIPKEIWSIYRPKNWAEIGRELGYTAPKALRSSINYSPSRGKLMQVALTDQNYQIYLLAASDIFWDEIISVEEIYGGFEVYDISIPKYHNFVANDIIVHNSYTLGVFAEGFAGLPENISSNISALIFDTLGIFWTMKYPNYRDDKLLSQWKLKPKSLNPMIFVPFGLFENYQTKGIPADVSFGLKPSEITANIWSKVFEIALTSKEGVLLERSLDKLEEQEFDINDIIKSIKENTEFGDEERNVLVNRFEAVKKWGLFKKDGTPITDLFKGGITSILDLSAYSQVENGQRIKDLVIAIVSKKILEQRMAARKAEEIKLISEGRFLAEGKAAAETEKQAPLVWIMIDEAHEFLPKEGGTLSTRPLIQLLREGRQPGISMILATQQPGKIHTDVMTQADVVITHRVTANIDITALNQISSTYIAKDIQYHIDMLPAEKGTALLIDDKLEKMYPIKVRPRFSWHGGEDPTAIRSELAELGLSFSFK